MNPEKLRSETVKYLDAMVKNDGAITSVELVEKLGYTKANAHKRLIVGEKCELTERRGYNRKVFYLTEKGRISLANYHENTGTRRVREDYRKKPKPVETTSPFAYVSSIFSFPA
ncbi:MAG: hypothetical protein KGI54_08725 [Pseudomonadota bacterium]|nr:hypothetical protein [Pseudomonadota bacterium]